MIHGGQRLEAAWNSVVGQGARLVEGDSISAGCARGEILDLVDAGSAIDEVVGGVEQIEDLKLERNALLLLQLEAALQAKVHLVDPGAGEGIQAVAGSKTEAGLSVAAKPTGGVVSLIVRICVAQRSTVGRGSNEPRIGMTGVELRDQADTESI